MEQTPEQRQQPVELAVDDVLLRRGDVAPSDRDLERRASFAGGARGILKASGLIASARVLCFAYVQGYARCGPAKLLCERPISTGDAVDEGADAGDHLEGDFMGDE